jgi:hypothetical protein
VATDRAEQRRIHAGLAAELARTAAAATRGEEPALVGVRFAPRSSGGRTRVITQWVAPPDALPAPIPLLSRNSCGDSRSSASSSAPSSLLTTRSLGDRGMSRLVIALPGVRHLRLHEGERARVLLASNGVWRAIEPARLRRVVKKHAASSAHACAKEVARAAQAAAVAGVLRARLTRGGGAASDDERAAAKAEAKRCCDDIAVIVVDIEPSRPPGQSSSGAAPAGAVSPESRGGGSSAVGHC